MKVICPMYVIVGKKRISVNLNQYRNLHHQVSNKAKIAFKAAIFNQIALLRITGQIRIKYTLYPRTSRKYDVSNVCSITDKFFCDALVLCGVIPDDNHHHVVGVEYAWGGVDRKGSGYVVAEIILVH